MTVAEGVQYWQQYIQPLAGQGYQLIAPVTSSRPNGLPWVQQWVQDCQGCTFDGIAVHYYGTSADDMITYVNEWKQFGKPIWITEFACQVLYSCSS
jgi:O-glycosyl hydrolase